MREIEAVFFDNDGTLTNTDEQALGGFEYALNVHGLPTLTRTKILSVFGLSLENCFKVLAPNFSDVAALCDAHREYAERHPELVSLYPGAEETLEKVRRISLKTAIITSRPRKSASRIYKSGGIGEKVDTVVTLDDVKNHKPHPEPLYVAAKRLGIETNHAVMVGDTDTDILAGKAAGAFTIGVKHGSEKITVDPDYLVEGIADIMPILNLEIGILMSFE